MLTKLTFCINLLIYDYWYLRTVARGFATCKIRHKEDSPLNECDREFDRKRRTNVCNNADVEDSPHNDDRLGLGGWVKRVGVSRLGGLG